MSKKAVLIDCSGQGVAAMATEKFQGKFLAETLAESILTSRQLPVEEDPKACQAHEVLRFFVGSPYEQVVAILWLDADEKHEAVYGEAKAFMREHADSSWSIGTGTLRYFFWADAQAGDEHVSRFLRGNTKCRSEWFVEINGLRCLADGHGFAVMADGHGEARIARTAQVMALAMAYQNALQEIATTIARAAKDQQFHPQEALKRVSFFMAGHYLAHPVLPHTLELREFYGLLSRKQDVAEQYREAVAQAALLAGVVREEQSRQEEERERQIARRVNRLGTWLAIASVIFAVFGVFQVTPPSIEAWWAAWFPPSAAHVDAQERPSAVGHQQRPESRKHEQACRPGRPDRSAAAGAANCDDGIRHHSRRAG